jgi:hypothetical protein
MRAALFLAALSAGCWDFEALSNGDGGLPPNADLAGRDANLDLALPDLATPPDLHRRMLSFAIPTKLGSDPTPYGIAVADFTGDGWPDFAVVSGTVHTFGAWVNLQQRKFTKNSTGPVFGGVNSWIGAGSIYGTGHVDLVVPNSTSLQGDGQGNFNGTPWTTPTAATPSALADFDGDGTLDIVTGDDSGIYQWQGDGKGDFTLVHSYIAGKKHLDLATADFDGDGYLDVVQADGDPTTGGVIVLHNDKGKLDSSTSYTNVHQIAAVATGDLGGDHAPDLVAIASGVPEALVFLNQAGTLVASPDVVPVDSGPMSAVIGDLDGDGNNDLVVSAFGSGTVDILLGDGTGKLVRTKALTPDSPPGKVVLADFDRDGLPDILVALPTGSGVDLFFNTSM